MNCFALERLPRFHKFDPLEHKLSDVVHFDSHSSNRLRGHLRVVLANAGANNCCWCPTGANSQIISQNLQDFGPQKHFCLDIISNSNLIA